MPARDLALGLRVIVVQDCAEVEPAPFVFAPIRDHAFFEQPQFQRLFGHDLLQITGLTAQIFDLGRCRCTRGVTGKALLPSLEEFLGPAVIQALRNALAPAQLRDTVLTLQAVQNDPDLLLGRILLARRAADVFDNLLAVPKPLTTDTRRASGLLKL